MHPIPLSRFSVTSLATTRAVKTLAAVAALAAALAGSGACQAAYAEPSSGESSSGEPSYDAAHPWEAGWRLARVVDTGPADGLLADQGVMPRHDCRRPLPAEARRGHRALVLAYHGLNRLRTEAVVVLDDGAAPAAGDTAGWHVGQWVFFQPGVCGVAPQAVVR